MLYKSLKIIAHILCWVPIGYILYAANNRLLGADPQESLLELLGLWTLIFLFLCLSITPVARIIKKPVVIKFRRLLGLYSAAYLLFHIATFFIFYLEMDLGYLVTEIVERPYITVGMLAALLLIPLSITSTKKMQRRLGRNWKRLHQLTYLVAILAIIHFIWQTKSDLNEPLTYLLWLVFLFGYRIYQKIVRKKTMGT